MIFQKAGKIAQDFHVLGVSTIPSYLWSGSFPVLFDSGISCLGGIYAKAARNVLGKRHPEILFLTHAHFDHVGSAAYLKREFPGLKIAASKTAVNVLSKPSAIERISSLNEFASTFGRVQASEGNLEDELVDYPFENFQVDICLEDEQTFDLGGGNQLLVFATPGHTNDFMTFYFPDKKILVASETVGCADHTGYIYSEFLTSFDDYLTSLRRLKKLEVDVLCMGHYTVATGDDARDHFDRSIEALKMYRTRVEQLLEEENGNVAAVVARVKNEEWDPRPGPKQPEPAYLLNTEARVRHIKELFASKSAPQAQDR